jgi:uncharacterized membrane protein
MGLGSKALVHSVNPIWTKSIDHAIFDKKKIVKKKFENVAALNFYSFLIFPLIIGFLFGFLLFHSIFILFFCIFYKKLHIMDERKK